jgi:hypothetical protein
MVVKSKTMTRKLIRITLLGVCVVVLALVAAAVGVRTYGKLRLAAVRDRLEHRWGPLSRPAPPAPVPDHSNGARWLVAGGRAISSDTRDIKLVGRLSGLSARSWTEEETAEVERILAAQEDAITLLLRAGTCSTFHLGDDGINAEHHEVEVLRIVQGLRLLVLASRHAWIEGRALDGIAALEAVSRSADGLLRTPLVFGVTGGAAAQRWSSSAALDVVEDPCADPATLRALRQILPTEDPIDRGNRVFAAALAEIADEGLDYIDDHHDPSLGWSVPFWIPNRTLFEDLVVAEILDSWSRFLELGGRPMVDWPFDVSTRQWGDSGWPPWLVMRGTFTPTMAAVWANAQAASSELHQLRLALEIRLSAPDGLDENVCRLVDISTPTRLTGEPVSCRFDTEQRAVVLRLERAEESLQDLLSVHSGAASFPEVVIPAEPCN